MRKTIFLIIPLLSLTMLTTLSCDKKDDSADVEIAAEQNQSQNKTSDSQIVTDEPQNPQDEENTEKSNSNDETESQAQTTEKEEVVEEITATIPEGYVDLGGSVYWSAESMSRKYSWQQTTEMLENSDDELPEMTDFEYIIQNCTWLWQDNYNGKKGYKVYKSDNPENYIFLASPQGIGGAFYANYWSKTPGDGFFNSLYFDSKYINPAKIYGENQDFCVITVRRK